MSVGAVNKQTGERIPAAGMPAVDAVLSGTSTNPVQNKVVKEELDAKQDTLTAGTYIQMDNGVISVKRDITQTAQTLYYHITIKSNDNYINVEKTQNGVKVSDTEYNWNVVMSNPANVDDCFTISTSGTNWVFTNLIASTTQPAGYAKTLYKSDPRYDYSTTYVTTVDADKKLIIQSELDDAMATKQDTLTFDDTPTQNSTNPVKSGGVYSAIAGKQDGLSAGSYIDISSNAVSVNRYVNPAGDIVYRAVTVNATTAYVDKYTSGGTFIERINITVNVYQTQNVESKIRFYREFDGWVITLLANSKEHNAGYSYSARTSTGGVESQNDFTFTISQTLDDNDLIIRSELATKANTDMVAADFNAGTSYTAGNYCVQDGKLYKFKNNHSGAWSATDVDEVKITGELSALKSGLTNMVKSATETITSNANMWLIFPQGRTILDASLASENYDTIVLTYEATYGYLSRFHLLQNTTTPQYEIYEANTEYSVSYHYI